MIRLGENLLAPSPAARDGEHVCPLFNCAGVRLERIVSHGQASPDGFWYDQIEDEWVTVLAGRARIRIADQPDEIEMGPGDTLLLPARCRHRVEWTSPDEPTTWLALYVDGGP
jgi:cupin 2 domain-containing protein